MAAHVAEAVAYAAMETGVSQKLVNAKQVRERLLVLAEEKQPELE